jgi:hypothetical protein
MRIMRSTVLKSTVLCCCVPAVNYTNLKLPIAPVFY